MVCQLNFSLTIVNIYTYTVASTITFFPYANFAEYNTPTLPHSSSQPPLSLSGNMAFPDQTSHFMAIQFGSPASVVPSPGTTAEYSPTIGMYSSPGGSSNQAVPATPSHLGSPHDFPQHGYLERVVAYDNTPYGYESIQRTNSIMAPVWSPPLTQQNRAILALLERGTAPLLISHYVETFKHMVLSTNLNGLAFAAGSGNLQYLAIVATIPTEELAGRILQVG